MNLDGLRSTSFESLGDALLKPVTEVRDYESIAFKCLEILTENQQRTVDNSQSYRVHSKNLVVTEQEAPPAFPNVSVENVFKDNNTHGKIIDVLTELQEQMRRVLVFEADHPFISIANAGGGKPNPYRLEGNALMDLMSHYTHMLINRHQAEDLVRSEKRNQEIDPVNHRELIEAGYLGMYAKCMIITTSAYQTRELIDYPAALLINRGKASRDPREHDPLGYIRIVQTPKATPVVHRGLAAWEIEQEMEYVIRDPKNSFRKIVVFAPPAAFNWRELYQKIRNNEGESCMRTAPLGGIAQGSTDRND